MLRNIKLLPLLILFVAVGLSSCKKEEYSFGDIKTPSGLALNTVIEGVDAGNPNGNGTGKVAITATANNAITYKIDFGDGSSEVVPTGKIVHKYSNPGTSTYMITVNAIGTAGVISTIS
ncbi:MAG: glucan endo-1,3-beta-D-glucosidase, partial [Chitinophagaceae bacterium]